jgi:hypothetical protein
LANERIWSTAAASLAIPTIDLGEKRRPARLADPSKKPALAVRRSVQKSRFAAREGAKNREFSPK